MKVTYVVTYKDGYRWDLEGPSKINFNDKKMALQHIEFLSEDPKNKDIKLYEVRTKELKI